MVFIETPSFSRYVAEYLTDDEYKTLQEFLMRFPQIGDVIPGTSGCRKLRWSQSKRGKGKRGGVRVIYYYFVAYKQLILLTIYDKNVADDLSSAAKEALRHYIDEEKQLRFVQRGYHHEKDAKPV